MNATMAQNVVIKLAQIHQVDMNAAVERDSRCIQMAAVVWVGLKGHVMMTVYIQ